MSLTQRIWELQTAFTTVSIAPFCCVCVLCNKVVCKNRKATEQVKKQNKTETWLLTTGTTLLQAQHRQELAPVLLPWQCVNPPKPKLNKRSRIWNVLNSTQIGVSDCFHHCLNCNLLLCVCFVKGVCKIGKPLNKLKAKATETWLLTTKATLSQAQYRQVLPPVLLPKQCVDCPRA